MGTIARTYDFVDGTVAEADEVDTDFNTIYSEFNGSIDNDNIKAAAAIAGSKLDSTVVILTTVQTLTNKRITKREYSLASSSTPTPSSDYYDMYTLTALAAAATFAVPTGTPTIGQTLLIRIKDNATARALSWNAIYRAGTDIALPTTTVISKTMYVLFIYNSTDTKWDLVAVCDGI